MVYSAHLHERILRARDRSWSFHTASAVCCLSRTSCLTRFPVPLRLKPLIRQGGHLVLETFGANGLNAIALPRLGEVSERVATTFSPVRYVERRTRRMPDRVTVKALLQRNAAAA